MKSAVVLTPQEGFGNLLHEALTSLGVKVAVYPHLQALPKQASPALVVVDGSIAPPAVLAAWLERQRARQPALRVLYLPTKEEKGEEIAADAVVEAPFYLPDFEATAARLLQQTPSTSSRPPWLRDVELAAQHLARLSMETAAQAAALVTPQGHLWAYAGELPQPAAEELARLTAHHWNWRGGHPEDFARFLHLEALQQDLLLYATAVTDDLVLVMAFDVQMPFSRIRAQATRLAEALTAETPSSKPPSSPSDTFALPSASEALPADEALPLAEPLATAEPSAPETLPAETSPPAETENVPLAPDDDFPPEAGEPLFDDVPPPEPAASEDVQTAQTVSVAVTVRPDTETDATSNASATGKTVLPAPPPSYTTVQYACVLIPRFPQHTLTGDLARDLSRWMPQIAIAFGWRLDHLVIRPTYMQWLVQVPPETSSAEVLRIVQQHTSKRIFAAYPRLAETNPSGHFWAPGYLLLSQNQPIPDETIHAFIAATRRQQGLAG